MPLQIPLGSGPEIPAGNSGGNPGGFGGFYPAVVPPPMPKPPRQDNVSSVALLDISPSYLYDSHVGLTLKSPLLNAAALGTYLIG